MTKDTNQDAVEPTKEEQEHIELFASIGWTELRMVILPEGDRILKGKDPSGVEQTRSLVDL